MKVNIRGEKMDVTEGIRHHIELKISKLDRYFENPDGIETFVIIRVRNLEQIIEVTIPTSKYTLRAEESHSDLYAAVDIVIDKLERQIRKNKTRLSKRFRDTDSVELNLNFEVASDEENQTESIVKRKQVNSKPMNEEEAILQMNLINHDFFLFKNIDENCFSVIYKRKDGNFGIINAK